MRTPSSFRKRRGRSSTTPAGRRSPSTRSTVARGAPRSVQILVEELLSGSQLRVQHVPRPSRTARALEVIEAFGTPEQKSLYCSRMFSGQWGGTMCLHRNPECGERRRRVSFEREEEPGRDVLHHRDQSLHLRRRPRPGREHRAPRPGARGAHSYPPAPRASPSSSSPRFASARMPLSASPTTSRSRASRHKMGINGSAT